MSKILANQIANYGDNSPIEVKEGVNIPAGKPLQVAGNAGTSGQVLSTTGTQLQWVTPFDGSYTTLTDKPTIPAAQINSDWNATSGSVAAILNKPVVPPQPSVSVASPSASGNLEYNQLNGLFTFTPPDLSGFASNTNEAQWNLAYSWGDHGTAGYATTSALNIAVANAGNWDTAYNWGDHAQAGYLTAEADTLDSVCERGKTGLSGGGQAVLTDVRIVGTDGIKASYFGSGALGGAGQGDLQMRHNDQTHDSSISHGNTLGDLTISSVTSLNLSAASGAGNVNISGNLLVSGTTDLDIEDLNNVDVSGGLSDQQVLKWNATNSAWEPANDLVGGATGVALSDLSVSTASAGTAGLSYNDTNGVFTFTPPDLSAYLTSETDPVFSAHVSSGILQTNINNWNAAYAWGDHSTAGYITTFGSISNHNDVVLTNLASNQLLQYNGSDWVNWTPNYLTTESDTLDTVTARGNTAPRDITLNGSGARRLDIQNNNAYAISLNASAGINTNDGVGLFIGNYGTNAWRAQIDGSNGNITTGGSLTAGGLTYPTTNGSSGDVLTSDGAGNITWAAPTGGSGGGANVTISDTAPGSASAGDLWWESDKGRLKIYYNDTDSLQWVDASPPLQAPNSPLYVGMVQLWNFGAGITWHAGGGASDGLTATIQAADGGGGFQNAYVRLSFPTSFVSAEDYAVQITVTDPSTDGHIYAPSIRKHLNRIDFYVYNLTSSAVATDWYASIAVYPL